MYVYYLVISTNFLDLERCHIFYLMGHCLKFMGDTILFWEDGP
jgi:hypothetical protein